MSSDPIPVSHYTQHALVHAETIARRPRGSATPAEKEAAEYIQAELKSMGIEDVKLEPFPGLRSLWLFIALALGLALVGHAAFWLLRSPAGNYPAFLVTLLAFGLSGLLLWQKFTFHDYPLRKSLPHGPSQNVVAILPPVDDVQRRVVLVSHLDSHRAIFWFANDILVALFAILSLVTLYGVYLAVLVYLLAFLTHMQFFAWIGLFLALFHFVGWFTGITADLGRYSPGANDNASGVGSILALAECLRAQPLQNTEIWLAFTGCEESGCDGMLSLIKQHGKTLREALFIDLEMVGIGDSLRYIHKEGNLRRRRIPKEVEALIQEVGEPFKIKYANTPPAGAFTEAGTLWEHGYKAVCISAYNQGSAILPEWHRLTDTPNRLQVDALERTHQLVWALLQRLDQG
jgi:Peptidase family M28